MKGGNVLLTHYDMDGVGCDIILSKLIKFDKKMHVGYGSLGKKLEQNVIYRYDRCFVTDLSLEREQLKKLIEHFDTKLFYADHHETTKKSIEVLKELNAIGGNKYKPRILYDQEMSGTGLIAKKLAKLLSATDRSRIASIVPFIDAYDMWRNIDYSRNFAIGYELNVLFWYYKYDKFFKRFCNGFSGFNKTENKIIEKHYKKREKSMNKATKVEISKKQVMYYNVNQEYINDYTLVFPEYEVYYMVYRTRSNELKVSMRTRGSEIDLSGYADTAQIMFDSVKNAGGHKCASGVNFKLGAIDNDALDVVDYIAGMIESGGASTVQEGVVPF